MQSQYKRFKANISARSFRPGRRRYISPNRRRLNRLARVFSARAAFAPSRNIRTGGFLGLERNYFDTYVNPTGVPRTTNASGGVFDPAGVDCLNAPAQGDLATNRTGHKITMKSLYIRGLLQLLGTDASAVLPNDDIVTIWVILDTQTNAAQMASENALVQLSTSYAQGPYCLRNLENGDRFRVLRTETFDLNNTNLSGASTNLSSTGTVKSFEWFIPLNDLVVRFNSGTTAAIGNVVDNSIHVVALSYNANTNMSYQARLRFLP